MNKYDSSSERGTGTSPADYSYRDEDTLRRLYHGEGLKAEEVASRLNCSSGTVLNWMEKLGVDRRPRGGFRVMKQRVPFGTGGQGYERWELSDLGEKTTIQVHRLVAVAEYGLEEVAGKDVHHKNGIGWDNRPENIEVLDRAEHSSVHAREQSRDGGKFT